MNLKKNPLDQVPDDSSERINFANKEFAEYDPNNKEQLDLFKAYIQKTIRGWAKNVPENAKYPDTVATLLGSGMSTAMKYTGLRIIDLSKGKIKSVTADDLAPLNFSKLCKDYLDLDVYEDMPNYDKKFNTAVGSSEIGQN